MSDARSERLADAVLEALDRGVAIELTNLDGIEQRELLAFEEAATHACAALARTAGPMPPLLAQRLCTAGRALLAERNRPNATPTVGPRARQPFLPFLLGAAAGIATTFALWPPTSAPLPADRRTALLQQDTTTRIAWRAGPSERHGVVAGDVVWNTAAQEGYLRLDGLQPLPPDHQYQLWIVDGTRTGAPVDGGLFDLLTQGEVVVPIQARLPVAAATAFVITVEQRGGAVVSEQTDVVAIASL